MHRRRYLQAVGGASAIGLAGCMGVLGSDGSDEAPDGESYEFEGEGKGETETFTLEEGLVALDFHNFGSGNVIVHIREAGSTIGGHLINERGAFDGTAAMNIDTAGEYYVNIRNADQWRATVRQPRFSESEFESIPFEASETDFALFGPFEFERDTEVSIEAQTDRTVGVDALTLDGNVATRIVSANPDESGYSETAPIGLSGQGLLYVDTMESWTLSVENP